MAKFAVGDKARYIGPAIHGLTPRHIGMIVTIEVVGTDKCPATIVRNVTREYPGEQTYKVRWPHGKAGLIPERFLERLSGDSLPSRLTNMLTVPQGDPDKVKQPEKVK